MRLAAAFRYRRLGKIAGLLTGRYDLRTLAKYLKKKFCTCRFHGHSFDA
jgi:hypothetical protein